MVSNSALVAPNFTVSSPWVLNSLVRQAG